MAERYGHQPILLIGKEASYGTEQTTPTIKLFDNFVATDGIESITVPMKTGKMEDNVQDQREGYKDPTCTISGILTDAHVFLLTALTTDTASPFVYPVVDTNTSYTIYRAFPESAADAGDGTKMTGCRLESLTFTTAGGVITYNAVFRAKVIDREADLAGLTLTGVTNTSWVAQVPFDWHDFTCSLFTASVTAMDTFSLAFTNEFMDNAAIHQNAQAKASDPVCGFHGQLSGTVTYDSVSDAKVFDYLLGTADIYDDVISFINTNATWAFTMKGQYIEPYDLPDIEKCKYKSSFTKRLCGDADEVGLSVVVS